MRVHGGGYIRSLYNYRSGSLPESKYSFRLYFRGDYGPGRLEQPIFPEVPAESFDTIVLRAGMNDSTNPFLRDEFARRLEADVGQVSARGTFVHLFLNGTYKGYYNPTERIGVDFLKTYHGGGDKWDIIAGPSEVVEGDNSAWRQLLTYATSFNLNLAERYQEIERRLDTTNFVEYLLPLIYGDTDDWPHNNWRAAREKVAGGLFRFYAWDAEWSFGFNSSPSHNTIANQLSSLSPPWGGTDIQRLFRALTNSYEFRLLFADRVHRHFFNDGALTDTRIRARYDWLKSQIAPAISGFNDSIGTSWIAQRRRYLTNHFAQAGLLASSNAPVFSLHGGRVPRGYALTMRAGLGDIYYTMDGSDPRTRFTGAIAPGAMLYSSGAPVVLDASAIVRARTRWGTNWSAVTEAVFHVQDFGLPLRIVEIMYHPPGDEPYEFIELENASAVQIDISNISLDGVTFRFLQGTILPGWGRVLLTSDATPAAFHSRYPGVTVDGYFKGSLSNSGEKLSLLDGAGRVIESVHYKDRGGWPTEADGRGHSLERINPFGDPSDPANWRASVSQGGSPGTENPVVPPPEVRLNEIYVCGDGSSGGGGSSRGWIEIFNSSDVVQGVSGWRLRNADGTKQYVFPPVTIGPKGYLLVRLGLDAAPNELSAGFSCDCSGESLFLEGPQGKRIDAVSFGQQARGYSIGRFGDEAEWQLSEPTPGAVNKAAQLASETSLVINELLANAVQGGTDWIELFNRDDHAPVALRGLSLGTSNALFQVTSLSFCDPRGHVLLIADEQSGPAHVNFKLPAARGFVVLYDALGNQIDRIGYTNAVEGVSLGRLPDGSATIRAFPGTPSPAAPNYVLPAGGLRINEIMAVNRCSITNAHGRYADWIELFNPDETEVDLSGMGLSADVMGGDGYCFPAGTKVAPNGYLVVWCDDEAPVSVEPGAVLNCGLRLRGEGGSVFLRGANGQLIDAVTYGFQHPEMSIGRTGSDWALLAVPTPGMENSGGAELGDAGAVRINEWMASANGADWLELHNPGPLPVNIGGLVLTDDTSLSGQTNHAIAPLTFIPGPGWVAYKADGDVSRGPDHLPFKLDALGETIRLYSKNYSVIDEVNLLVQERGVSEGRFPDGSTNIARLRWCSSSAGPNFLVNDTVVINEIMYHPVSYSDSGVFENVAEEYIELYNMSDVDVPLFDLEHPANTWRITGGIEFCFPANMWLGPGSFLIVVPFDPSTDADARTSFANKYQINGQARLVGPWRGKLANEGETLELMKPGRPQVSGDSGSAYVSWIPVDWVCYSGQAPWPVAANGTGFSLQRIVPSAYGNAPGHWCAIAPTPGAVNIPQSLDSDGDGLPDVWEIFHGLNPFVATGQDGPDGDPDGDGLTNVQEYVANTDPRSATLRILNFSMGENEIWFTCNAMAGIGYAVEACESLQTPVWNVLIEFPAPDKTGIKVVSIPLDALSDARFFRLKLRDSGAR
ncbi:MAG: lamin tail domain-containing protein [Verrucomicrobiia bacterium]